jgi:hypothetical protein
MDLMRRLMVFLLTAGLAAVPGTVAASGAISATSGVP